MKQERTFDYVPRLVEDNLRYLVRNHETAGSKDPEQLMRLRRWWTGGRVLDQGAEGACVGFGVSAEAAASPMRVRGITDQVARSVYKRCLQIDEYEGEEDLGTSVRAGALVGRENGWWKSFHWAKNMAEVRQALEVGPVVIGVQWREGMYETLGNGIVEVDGPIVGKHCILLTGYSPDYDGTGPRYRWRNSWGLGYGKSGNGYIAPADLNEILFEDGNEACVLDRRGPGRRVPLL